MNSQETDDGVGYKRPPVETRWKKGQCGNPGSQYKRAGKSIVKIIDEIFETQIDIVCNGICRRGSIFEAIVLQLWNKAISGNRKAANVLLEYLKFASSSDHEEEFIIECAQNEYTRRLAEKWETQREPEPNG